MSLILGGISAATSIIGGILGKGATDKANKDAREHNKTIEQLGKNAAESTNRWNHRKHDADKFNYDRNVRYQFETAVQNWNYGNEIRALEESVDAEKYLLNVKNSLKQLTFNNVAAVEGKRREQFAQNDARAEYAHQRQDALVSQMVAEGEARLGQAGGSMNKRVQSSVAEIGRDIATLSASLTGQIHQSQFNMFDINMGKFAADARVEAARMIRPEALPDIPAPTMPPEPHWIAPMDVQPGYVAPPVQQDSNVPLIQGIGGAISTLASINWNTKGTAQETYDPTKRLGLGANIFGGSA